MSETEKRVCPHCGGRYYLDSHPTICSPSAYENTDTCPMCGEEFSGYLDHLKTCDGGD